MSNDTKKVVNGVATFVSKENTPPDITITADDGSVSSISRIFQRQSSQCATYETNLGSPASGQGPRLAIDNSNPTTLTANTPAPSNLETSSVDPLVEYIVLEEGAHYETLQRVLGGSVGHYSLNDPTSSATAVDSTGQYDGTYTGEVVGEATSLLAQNGGTAVDFGGTGFLDLGNGTQWDFIHDVDDFTVSSWVSYVNNGDTQYVLANATDPAETGFSVSFDGGANVIRAGVSNGTSRFEVTFSLSNTPNGVYHLVFTANDGVLELFVNNVSAGTTPYTGVTAAAQRSLQIAALEGGQVWGSVLDEVNISTSPASSAIVNELYSAGI